MDATQAGLSARAAARPLPTAVLDVGVLGAGRVGAVLGAALERAGHRVVATSAVSEDSLRRAATLLPGVPVVPAAAVPRDADLVLLTVPDDVLPELVRNLVATEAIHPGQLVAHTSGRHGLAVLEPVARIGGLPLALHPVLPFRGTRDDLTRLTGASFGVTAPPALRETAEALVRQLGAEPVWVEDDQRALWHAALASGANHLSALVATAADLLRQAGATDPSAVLRPLLESALEGTLRDGDAALTGPVVRGDAGTVRTHLQTLAADAPEVLPSYVAMARLTADRAIASGRLAPAKAGALLEVLGSVPR